MIFKSPQACLKAMKFYLNILSSTSYFYTALILSKTTLIVFLEKAVAIGCLKITVLFDTVQKQGKRIFETFNLVRFSK